jgi:hypothetical protein
MCGVGRANACLLRRTKGRDGVPCTRVSTPFHRPAPVDCKSDSGSRARQVGAARRSESIGLRMKRERVLEPLWKVRYLRHTHAGAHSSAPRHQEHGPISRHPQKLVTR